MVGPEPLLTSHHLDSYKYSRGNSKGKGKYLKGEDNPTFLGKIDVTDINLVKLKCCRACFETYETISHISWHKDGNDCDCFDISGTPDDTTSNGWRWGPCSREVVVQGRRRRQAISKGKVQRKKREVTTTSTTSSTSTTTTTASTTIVTTTAARSVHHRDLECTKFDVTGLNLYWKYQYEIPSYCHSKSLQISSVRLMLVICPGINCTKTDLDTIDNDNQEMTLSDYDGKLYYESVQEFKCQTFGKSFYNQTANSYSLTRSVACDWDRKWRPEAITEPCRCESLCPRSL